MLKRRSIVITITRISLITLFLAVFCCSSHCSKPADGASAAAASANSASAWQSFTLPTPLERPRTPDMPLESAQARLKLEQEKLQDPYCYKLDDRDFVQQAHNLYMTHKGVDVTHWNAHHHSLTHPRLVLGMKELDEAHEKIEALAEAKNQITSFEKAAEDPNKSKSLRKLLKKYDSYWWAKVAVLAAQQKKDAQTIQDQATEIRLLREQSQQKAAGVPQAPDGANK